MIYVVIVFIILWFFLCNGTFLAYRWARDRNAEAEASGAEGEGGDGDGSGAAGDRRAPPREPLHYRW